MKASAALDQMKDSFWKYILPLHKDVRLLLLGADDVTAASLGVHCKSITHLPHFNIVRNWELPFAAASFDSVVWVDSGAQIGDIQKVDLDTLVYQLLRLRALNGTFIVVARNPNWPPTLRWFSPRARSGSALESALKKAGLGVSRFLMSPKDGTARHLFSKKCPGFVCDANLSTRARWRRRATATWLWNWLATGFLLIAYEGKAAPQTLAGRIANEVAHRAGKTGVSIQGIQAGNPATCLMRIQFGGESTTTIVRIPMEPRSRMRCKKNYQFLSQTKQYIPAHVPRTIACGDVDGQEYFAESALDGIAVDEPHFPLGVIAAEATQVLVDLHRASMRTDREGLMRFVDQIFTSARESHLITADEEVDCGAYCRASLSGGVPTVLFHGDYKIENVIVDSKQFHLKGIIDWDLAHEQGAPLIDLLFLLTYRRITLTGQPFNKVFVDTVLANAWNESETALLQRYAEALKIDIRKRLAYDMLFWLHHYAYRVSRLPDMSELRATFKYMHAAMVDARLLKGSVRV